MYKLLVAEDEKTIREGIVSSNDWKLHGIEVCAEASNGEEALILIEKFKPDIFITDIQMPKYNGLDIIQQAQEKGFTFESIVLTGYADFNYAKKSIQLSVFDYLLKPAQPSKILEAVLRAKQKMEQAQLMDEQLHLLEQYTDRSNYFDKVDKLQNWFHFPKQSAEDNRQEILHQLQMNIDYNEPIHVGIIRLPFQNKSNYIDDYDLLKFACMNITLETLTSFYNGHLEVLFDQELLVWIGNIKENFEPTNLSNYLSQLVGNFEKYIKVSIFIGIGDPKTSIDSIHQAYKEAKEALDEQFYHKEKNTFFYQELNEVTDKQILYDQQLTNLEEGLIADIDNKQYDAALDKLESWLDYLRENTYYHKDQINLKAITIIIELQKFVQGKTLTRIEWENDLVNWIEQMPTMRTFDEMSSILKKIFQNVFEILTSERSVHRTVQRAQSIIQERYFENLTLESIASEVFVSSAYLSSLFKQELGINFLDYLHQYRISKAKALLFDSYKVYEVANKTGYKDERHFSTTFKKWTGTTPSQFQKQARV
ncbi:response regulator [Aquibacillus koreensis]|uniref:Response regulator n=1 Tax=Aquibacillus koreensis TaxID=279446 RepID=A0A9X3WJV0_9BACI|nr:helix-turn-helix domain-containing protein [Aquibacillus koreensis]MCT2537074.1 response regulator [Aquibacillus koreensis]MDC3419943.1 response regulator [Aquibacillus koreensis]